MTPTLAAPAFLTRKHGRLVFAALPLLVLPALIFGGDAYFIGANSTSMNLASEALPPADAADAMNRFLELEGPHTQPANYPGCAPGLPLAAVWGVVQASPPAGRVEVDPSGAFARVHFQGSAGPNGSRITGAIRFTPQPDRNGVRVDYEDLAFAYTSGTWTYRGQKRVDYHPASGRIIAYLASDAPLSAIFQASDDRSGSSVVHAITGDVVYAGGPGSQLGFACALRMKAQGKTASPGAASDIETWGRPIQWSPLSLYPTSGATVVSARGSHANANQRAMTVFQPGGGSLSITPEMQATHTLSFAPWPGRPSVSNHPSTGAARPSGGLP